MKECECREKANREYEANVNGQCSGMTGADYEACKMPIWEALQKALEKCTPTPPSRCELKAEAVYEHKKKECMAAGIDCEDEAQALKE
jgi:hypothetical protein